MEKTGTVTFGDALRHFAERDRIRWSGFITEEDLMEKRKYRILHCVKRGVPVELSCTHEGKPLDVKGCISIRERQRFPRHF